MSVEKTVKLKSSPILEGMGGKDSVEAGDSASCFLRTVVDAEGPPGHQAISGALGLQSDAPRELGPR